MSDLHVVFGTGSLGLAVMRELRRRGHRVRLVNRKGRADMASDPEIEVVAGDASDPGSTKRVCAGAKVVYICAACQSARAGVKTTKP